MDVATVSLPENEAEEIYQGYLEAVKTRKEKYLEDLKKVYHALSQGKKVIDIFEAFKKTGVNEAGEPKLAISLASNRQVFFHKETGGAGMFSGEDWNWAGKVADVRLPAETFPEWAREQSERAFRGIARRRVVTNVPLVPAHLLPEGKLDNYYLLWEASEWTEAKSSAKAADPFLLRRINTNTFVVLAEWDLTEVEQIVMRGE